jgi:AraC family transcriptional regulator
MDIRLNAPTIETMPERHFAGPVQRYTMQTRSAIPQQWQAYTDAGTKVAGAIPGTFYGIAFNVAPDMGSFDYLCGQEVPAGAILPAGFDRVTIAGPYARFATKGHISTMNGAWNEVYAHWLTLPDLRPRPGPAMEYYPPEFDGMTGEGGFEIWVAVAA